MGASPFSPPPTCRSFPQGSSLRGTRCGFACTTDRAQSPAQVASSPSGPQAADRPSLFRLPPGRWQSLIMCARALSALRLVSPPVPAPLPPQGTLVQSALFTRVGTQCVAVD